MKKIMYLLSIVIMVILVGCGSTGPKMADFTKAYADAGATVESDKQYYSMVGAIDGAMFSIDDNPIKVYEFASQKDLDKAKKDFSFVNDWPVNGLFALETDGSKAKDIFISVK